MALPDAICKMTSFPAQRLGRYVVVNGKVVIDGGRHTGVLAGRALRRGRAST